MAPRRDDNTSCFLLDRREDTRGSKYNGSTPGGWTSLDEKSRGCEAEQTATKKHFLQTPLNIFVPFLSLSVPPSVLQERCRSRTARKQTKGSTSVWPPTLKACATPPPPTYMCEVGREHRTHVHTHTTDTKTNTQKARQLKVLSLFLNTAIYFSITVL